MDIGAGLGSDTFDSIEGVIGGDFDDILKGTSSQNTLIGGAGNDTLYGLGSDSGADFLDGGEGDQDFVSFNYDSAVNITVDLSDTTAQDTDGVNGDDLIIRNIENVEGGTLVDSITGNSSDNTISTLAGDDTVFASGGDDYIDGGADTNGDTVSYKSTNGVTVDIQNDDSIIVTKSNGTDTLVNVENIIASDEDDTLNGNDNANIFHGEAGDDVFDGKGGDDTLYGESGNDTFVGGTGNDTIDGGIDTDTVDYSNRSDGIDLTLVDGDGTAYIDTLDDGLKVHTTGEEEDSLISIENVIGSQDHDIIIGDVNSNTLYGEAGDDSLGGDAGQDVIYGGTGADIIEGGSGADTMYGESGDDVFIQNSDETSGDIIYGGVEVDTSRGSDTVDYSSSDRGIKVNLNDSGLASVTIGSSVNDHSLSNIENIVGTSGSDTIEGDTADNILDGSAGTDTISYANTNSSVVVNIGNSINSDINFDSTTNTILASSGVSNTGGTDTLSGFENIEGSINNDTLIGNDGVNTIDGGIGNDLLLGGAGSDSFIGGVGNDTVSYALESSVDVSLRNGTGIVGADTDQLTGIENIIGTSGNDTIEGDANNNTLVGAGGTDTLSYAGVTSSDNTGVTVDLSLDTVVTGTDGTDVISGFENLIGSNKNDILTGDSGVNVIDAGNGDDTLRGGAGADILNGETGNDTFIIDDANVDNANDIIDGGANTDTIDYSAINSANHINVNLSTPTAQVLDGTTILDSDTLSNIENVIGSSNDDTITGDSQVNILSGNDGDDTLDGGANADTLFGNAGDDLIIQKDGETTNDVINGGTHSTNGDTVDYSDLNSNVSVTMLDGVASNVYLSSITDHTIQNIENITGSANNDTLTGNSAQNTLLGGAGDDTIDGGSGEDYLDGGTSTSVGNTLTYDSSNYSVRIDLGSNSAITDVNGNGYTFDASGNNLDSGDEQDTILNFKTAEGSNYDDILIAGDNGNTLLGNTGLDTLESGAGADYLDGGANADTFILGKNDAVNGVDTIVGGTGRDTADYSDITDSSRSITVELEGSEIKTVTINGAANDTLQDVENVIGGAGNDSLVGDGNVNTLMGGAGVDFIDGADGKDLLYGGDGNDTILGGDKEDTLYGDAGDDTLNGEDGADTLFGGAGDDTLAGGAGIDYLDGGSQNSVGDSVDFSAESGKLDINLRNVDTDGYSQAQLDNIGDDYLRDIENIRATNQDDYIGGNDSVNTLIGLNGNDTIVGDDGDDYLEGGEGDDIFKAGVDTNGDKVLEDADDGADFIDGGSLSQTSGDTIDYSAISKSIDVTLNGSSDSTVNITDYSNDTIRNIENVIGSSANDTISGDSNNNSLDGSLGDDTLYGAGGNDTLNGGAGVDTADYTQASSSIIVDMSISAGEVTNDGDGGVDNLIDIEKVVGSNFDDSMTGNDSDNTFVGADGYDKFYGTKGDDVYYSGNLDSNGTHVLDSDYSKVDYSNGETGKIYVDLSTTISDGTNNYAEVLKLNSANSSDVDFSNADYTDRVYDIVNITGTDSNDTIIGNAEDNYFKGEGGNDTLIGNDGSDILEGGAGQDLFIVTGAQDGVDIINGGSDIDTVDFSALGVGNEINITLNGTDTLATLSINGTADIDEIQNVENIIATQGSDSVTGNSDANVIYGQAGNDQINGNAGDDTLYGEDGDDTLKGGFGDDYIDGGANGSEGDTVDYSDATSGVTVDMSGSSVSVGAGLGTDTLVDIENALGSDYDDTFITDETADNKFYGGSEGVNGDTVDYSSRLTDSNDKIEADLTTGTVDIYNDGSSTVSATDTLFDIENITGSAGNDTISGDSSANTLIGLAGDDTISGSAGNDHLDGGTGSDDRVDYSYSTAGVTIDLENETGVINVTDSDTIIGFENVTGSTGNDTIIMKSSAGSIDGIENEIDGNSGDNDTISYENYSDNLTIDLTAGSNPTADNDILTSIENVVAGTGNDTLISDVSIDNDFDGNSGNDTIDYSSASTSVEVTLNGSTTSNVTLGNGTIDSVRNIENVTGGSANDTVIGDSNDNTLLGNDGLDTLTGGVGADYLDGGADSDSLYGSAGMDTIYGDAGADYVEGGSDNDLIYGDDLANTVSGNDTLLGEGGDDTIHGGQGNDILDGDVGNDILYGEAGNDTLIGGQNNDILDGGDGIDTVDYQDASGSVTVDLGDDGSTSQNIGAAEGYDRISNIENVIGSNYDDLFYGANDVANVFNGGVNESGEVNGDTVDYSTSLDQSADSINVDLSVSGTVTVTDADGSGVADTLIDIENITGSAGNDFIGGDSDNNTLKGEGGNDTLRGDGGDDHLDGGDGSDTVTYENESLNVIVDLDDGTATGTGIGDDTLVDIENVIGGDSNDTIIMREGAYDNSINGGTGTDTISYETYVTTGVDVNLSTTQSQTIATSDNDILTSIENVIGSGLDDTFIGSTQDNIITGNAGSDRFIAGTDTNNDGVLDTWTDDGADTYDGGAGVNDWVDYSVITGDGVAGENGIDLTLDTTNPSSVIVQGQSGTDILLNVEHVSGTQDSDIIQGDSANNSILGNAGADDIKGGAGSDNLYGGADNDTITGEAGDDTLYGEAGDDTLTGDVGDDIIYGGDATTDSGSDTVDYTNALESLTITLDTNLNIDNEFGDYDAVGTSDGASGEQGQGDDILYGIENVIGSNYASDIVYGSHANNIISTLADDDTITGYNGDDNINAGSGDDTIYATSNTDGNDVIDGGTGSDTLDYQAISNDIAVNLLGNDTDATLTITSGDSDTVRNIENIFAGSGDDVISGNADVNTLVGNGGNDTISGEEGIDYLYGDAINGTGTGNDTVSYEYATADAQINLNTESAYISVTDNDTISSFENVISGSGNDSITGSSVANTLQGGAGDDTFSGLGGDDVIYGGTVGSDSGNDTIDYTSEARVITTLGEGASVTVGTSGETDTIYGIENIKGSNTGNDTITGDSSNNSILGQGGDDTLKGAGGADYLNGGAGDDLFLLDTDGDATGDEIIGGADYDTVSYHGLSSGVTVDLSTGSTVTVDIDGNTHTLTGIEHLRGTDSRDILSGDTNINRVEGMGGNDSITGNDGSDQIYGGANEANSVGSGDDTLDGRAGDDFIRGGDGSDTIYGGDGKDILYGEQGIDTIEGEAGTDTIYGGDSNDLLNGGLGADTIYGEDGDDTITFVQADNSTDYVYGGTATADSNGSAGDTVDYSQAITGMTVNLAEGNNEGTATSADQGTDYLYGIENIIGSNLDSDTITGNSDVNTLSGMGDDDTLYGLAGEDTLLGGAGSDELHGGADNDSIDGGIGNDFIYGDAGADTLVGNQGNDSFIATSETDGIDSIIGGTGSDTVDYSVITDNTNSVTATLLASGDSTVDLATGDDDIINGIENIIGTSGNDTFTGSSLSNTLVGGDGVDEVRYDYDNGSGVNVDLEAGTATEAGGVVDRLITVENVVGSDYDDTFVTESGVVNTIDGGNHINGDMIDYSSTNSAIEVTLNTNTQATVDIAGTTFDDIISNIEHVRGSTSNDTIAGDTAVNTLYGMAGNDELSGGAGQDYLDGGSGNDTLIGGADADSLIGGTGNDLFTGTEFTADEIDGGTESDLTRGSDTVDYSNVSVSTTGVEVTLNNNVVSSVSVDGNADDHTIVNVENINGTSLSDTITGDSDANSLIGNAGTDTINGGAGDDYIDGGANATGTEILIGGLGLDTIYGGSGVDYIQGGDDNDILYGNEDGDTLDGGAGVDTLDGGDGDDTLIGGAGNDNLIGGLGSDTADYSNESASIQANIANSFAVGTSIGTDTFNSIENITGTNLGGEADQITGNDSANILKGLAGNDTISEMAGDDTVEGGAGNDYIYAGAGDDIIDGDDTDAGTVNGTSDTLDYSSIAINDDSGDDRVVDSNDGDATNGGVDAYLGIEVDLSITTSQRIHAEYGNDTITNIENIIGSDKGDYLAGNDSGNILEGRAGNDYLIGLDGQDRLIGGSGVDTADFTTGSENVVIDMTKSQTDGSDNTYRIENDGYGNAEYLDGVENIITGSGNDTIYGDAQSNTITTGSGNDTIRGGAAADVINGGADEDTVDFSDLAYGVTVDLDTDNNGSNAAEGTALSNGNTDVLREIENVIGTERADNITGDDKDNTLFGGADNDIFKGLEGQDYIDGGDGSSDTIDYSDGTQGIKVDLNATQVLGTESTYRVQDDGFANAEFITGIENITGTSSVDTIIGDGNNNILDGGASGDTIYGGAGSDTLVGQTGADTFAGGAGDDFIYGNALNVSSADSDRDVVDYSSSSHSILLNLSSTSSTIGLLNETTTIIATQTAVGEGTDRLYDIQDVIGSNLADTMVGDDSDNSLLGNGGNDILIGGLGADVIEGQGDNDTILGGLDNDMIYGGSVTAGTHTDSGNDTVNYSYLTDATAINVDLSLDDNDSTTNNEQEIKVVGDATRYDSVEGIENVVGTRNNDTIKGSDDFSEVNTLDGYSGNDTFYASQGVDTFIGGDGVDTLDFSNIDVNNTGENAVIVDLGLEQATDDGYQNGGSAVVDTIREIEVVIGTNGDDQLRGSSVANTLVGGLGNDTIVGIAGANLLQGEDGNDSITGGSNADTIEGGIGNDTLDGSQGNDSIDGGAGNDIINRYAATGDDSIDAGTGDDTIYSGEGSNTITGGTGSDTLTYEQITTTGITVNLGSGVSNDFGTVTVGSETDTLEDHIEIIKGSADTDTILGFNGTAQVGVDYSDTFYGQGSMDSIYGGIGDDTIYGENGDDTLSGQAGNDSIDGGAGTDTIDFADADVGVRVYLNQTDENNVAVAHHVMEDGFGGQDDVTSVEKVIGSAHDDIIKGTDDWNDINAGAGDDTIIATSGGDAIEGGSNTTGTGGGDWLSFEALNSAVNARMQDGQISGGLGSTTISGIENLLGTTYNDTLIGDDNNNSLDGNSGDDTLNGGNGSDYLFGNDGNDTLIGGDGVDTYDGGDGEDVISFYDIEASVDVNLQTSTVNEDGYGNTESGAISNVENIIGSLNYADRLTGDNNDNTIFGYGGNDTINGLGGFDTIYAGTGSDIINTGTDTDDTSEDVAFGQEGIDTFTGNFDKAVMYGDSVGGANLEEDWIDYSNSSNGITVDLSGKLTDSTYTLDSANDDIDGTYVKVINNDSTTDFDLISQIENIIGTDLVDTLGGVDTEDNSILAGDGDDTIFHSNSVGNNYVDGEDGSDWLSLEYYTENIDLNSSSNGIYNIENVLDRQSGASTTIWGSDVSNTFIMYDGNDQVIGRYGDDVYDLGDGDDNARAGGGSDTLIGGAGQDLLDYRNSYTGNSVKIILQDASIDLDDDGVADTSVSEQTTTITLSGLDTVNGDQEFFLVTDSRNETDYILKEADGTADFERFNLSNVDDTFVGDDGDNTVSSSQGNDTVLGMGGDDIINGNEGADLIFGGDGADVLRGDDGDDRLYGNAGDDNIAGGENNDTIWGGSGTNILSGDNGTDIIHDEEGTDTINGGNDEDTVIFKEGTQGVDVNLGLGTSTDAFGNSQTISNVENLTATSQDDILIGEDGVTNIIYGLGGNDTFTVTTNEEGKSDYIYGGDGNADKVILTSNLDGTAGDANSNILVDPDSDSTNYDITVDMLIDNNIEFVSSGTNNSTKMYDVENVDGSDKDDYIKADSENNTINSGAGNDYVQGLLGDDEINAGDGNDIVEGGAGNDTLDGGANIDTLVYTNATSGVTVNLDTGLSTGTSTGNDTISNFENIVGSNSSDTLTGDNSLTVGNTIYGQGGTDTIYGLAGDDELHGGDNDDYIDGGTGNDNMYGEAGDDTFITSAGDDVIDGGENSDTVDYTNATGPLNVTLTDSGVTTINIDGTDSLSNIENLTGTNSNDNITGESNNNTFIGNAGDDILVGAGGDDNLQGGTGDDTLYGGTGTNTIDGGEGGETTGDWINYTDVTGSVNIDLSAGTATGAVSDTISNIEHVQMGDSDDIVQGDIYNNSLLGGAGTDTLSVSSATGGVTFNVSNNDGTTNGAGVGTDNFESFENFIGSNNNDTFNTDAIDNITFNGEGGTDTVDYTSSSSNIDVTVNGSSTVTATDSVNTDTLNNVEKIISGSGDDTFTLNSVNNIDTLDAGAGTDSLSVTSSMDLSSVELINFEEILAQDGQVITVSATALNNENITLHTQGSGQIIVETTTNLDDHNFDNVTVNNESGTGTITLNVTSDIDLSSKNIEGTGTNIFDEFDVNSGVTLTVDATQVDGEIIDTVGNGDIIINATTTASDHDFDNLTNTGNGDITLNVDSSINLSSQNLGAINRYDVAASQTLTLLTTQLTSAMIIAGAGAIDLNSATTTENVDLSSINNDNFTGTLTLNDGSSDNNIIMSDKVDIVNLSSGNDTVNLGAGDDIVNITNTELSTSDSIDGGLGNDTLNINGTGNVDLTTVSSIETINLSDGSNTVTVGTLNSTIEGGSGADTFEFNIANLSSADVINGNNGIDTLRFLDNGTITANQLTNVDVENIELANGGNDITVGTKDFNITGGTGNDTFNYAIDNLSSNDVINGNGGTNNVTFSSSGQITSGDFSNVTNISDVNFANGDDEITLSASDSYLDGVSLNLGAGNNEVIFNGIETLDSSDTIVGGGTDTITFANSGSIDSADFVNVSGIDNINFASGNNTVTLSDNSLDTVDFVLDSGNDNINISSSNLSSADTIDAGTGTDSLNISDTSGTITYNDADFTNLNGFETLNLGDGSADTITIGTTQIAEAGFTNYNGRAGNDTFIVNSTSNLTSIDGGDNQDTLTINTDNLDFSSVSISNIETLNINGNTNLEGSLDASITALTVASGKTLTIDAASLNGVTITNNGTINITNLEANPSFDLSSISGNVNASWSGDGTFTGDVGTAALTIESGTMTVSTGTINTASSIVVNGTLVADASKIDSTTISGSGTLTVNNLETTNIDFSTINVNTINTSWSGTGTFTGDLTNVDTLSVDSGTMTVSDDILGTLNVTGNGSIVVQIDSDSSQNFSTLGLTGTETIQFTADSTFTGNFQNSQVLVDSGTTLTTDASLVSGRTVTNNGTVQVTNLDGTLNANLSTISGTVNTTWDGNGTFVGNLSGVDTLTVSSGTMQVDASTINSVTTITNDSILNITNLDSVTNMDFTKVTNNNTLNAQWSGTDTFTGDFTGLDNLTINSGTMSVDDSILGTLSVDGSGNLTVNADDSSMNLSNVNISGTTTINDSSSSTTIVGTSNDDILNLNSGNDTVNLGTGDDTVNVSSVTDLNTSDNIDAGIGGNDTLNITDSGVTIDSANLIDVSNFENLNLSSGDDTITFDNTTEFNNFTSEFTNINDAGGNDTLSFGNTSVNGDLDFSKLNDFENLNLSSSNDSITLSGDEPQNIDGLAGDDNFTLDFTSLDSDSFNIDGGANNDTVSVTGSTNSISLDTTFGDVDDFSNMETIDLTGMTFNTAADSSDGGTNAEWTLDGSLIDAWGNGTDDLIIRLNSSDASKIEFTDSSNNKFGGDDSDSTALSDGATYTLNDGNGGTVDVQIDLVTN